VGVEPQVEANVPKLAQQNLVELVPATQSDQIHKLAKQVLLTYALRADMKHRNALVDSALKVSSHTALRVLPKLLKVMGMIPVPKIQAMAASAQVAYDYIMPFVDQVYPPSAREHDYQVALKQAKTEWFYDPKKLYVAKKTYPPEGGTYLFYYVDDMLIAKQNMDTHKLIFV